MSSRSADQSGPYPPPAACKRNTAVVSGWLLPTERPRNREGACCWRLTGSLVTQDCPAVLRKLGTRGVLFLCFFFFSSTSYKSFVVFTFILRMNRRGGGLENAIFALQKMVFYQFSLFLPPPYFLLRCRRKVYLSGQIPLSLISGDILQDQPVLLASLGAQDLLL